MKRILFSVLSVFTIAMYGCGTLTGLRKAIYLVDAPKDLVVEKDGEAVQIRNLAFDVSSNTRGTVMTSSQNAGIKIKVKQPVTLDLKTPDKKGSVDIVGKPWITELVLEGLFTFGIGTVVDLLTGGAKKPVPEYIDVPAILNNTEPRTKKELRRAMYQGSN